MNGSPPNFLIIGAMRCGTTLLAHYLNLHSQIFIAPEKEIHFFDTNFANGPEWYWQRFSGVNGEYAIGEATQTYMYDPQAVSRMAELLPHARLIAILRNPLDRAYSHYWHSRIRGKESLSFVDAIATEQQRRNEKSTQRERFARFYLERGRYISQLENVCSYYARDTLCVILLDDMRDDPLATVRSLYRFLAVDDAIRIKKIDKRINRSVRFRSLKLRSILKTLPARSLARRLGERLNTVQFDYPPLDSKTKSWLYSEYFAEDVDALEDWLGRDLSMWKMLTV